MTFFERMKSLMDKRDISGREFADMLGITSANMTFWKQGTMPKVNIAYKAAKILGVTVEYLLTGETESEASEEELEFIRKMRQLAPGNRNAVKSLLESLYQQEQEAQDLSKKSG